MRSTEQVPGAGWAVWYVRFAFNLNWTPSLLCDKEAMDVSGAERVVTTRQPLPHPWSYVTLLGTTRPGATVGFIFSIQQQEHTP